MPEPDLYHTYYRSKRGFIGDPEGCRSVGGNGRSAGNTVKSVRGNRSDGGGKIGNGACGGVWYQYAVLL